MKLTVTTPTEIVVQVDEVTSVRADDPTGNFGVQRGHADFLTVLVPSVLIWKDTRHRDHFVAVRGGVFTVRDGNRIDVATREAVLGDDLADLDEVVETRFRRESEAESRARGIDARLHFSAIRLVRRYIDPSMRKAMPLLGTAQNAPEIP